jgi:hypothetical protein
LFKSKSHFCRSFYSVLHFGPIHLDSPGHFLGNSRTQPNPLKPIRSKPAHLGSSSSSGRLKLPPPIRPCCHATCCRQPSSHCRPSGHHWLPASRPLRSARQPIKGTPSTTAPHRTSSHFLHRLSVPPLAPHQAPPPPFIPLCRRPYLTVKPVAKDPGEVPRLPLFVLKPSWRALMVGAARECELR